MVRVDCNRLPIDIQVQVFTSPNYSEGFPFRLAVPLFGCCKGTTCIGDHVPFFCLRVNL